MHLKNDLQYIYNLLIKEQDINICLWLNKQEPKTTLLRIGPSIINLHFKQLLKTKMFDKSQTESIIDFMYFITAPQFYETTSGILKKELILKPM